MPIATCAVTGDVKSLLNASVQNCEITVAVNTPFFHGDTWISGQIGSVLSDVDGAFSISIIETETVGQTVTITFRYFDGSANRKLKKYTIQVPNTATATLASLVNENIVPIDTATFPAQYVTVGTIANLTATNAQTAFAEHQDDIDTLQAGQSSGSAALAAHIADTTTHGTTGDIVGTSDTQTLTNKTIDGDSNTISDTGIASLKTDLAAASTFISRNASGVVISTKAVPAGGVVGTSDTQTLTGKTIDGDDNTVQDLPLTAIKTVLGDASKFLARDASGIPVSVNTVPTSTVVGINDTQTLTNKTISGASNTITNVSLTTGVTGTLPIANGGTGQTGANAAFNALAPSQGSNSGKFLTTNGTDTSWATVALSLVDPFAATNLGLAASVSGNALTLAIKTAGGSDASAGSPVTISFRSSTLTSGAYNSRTVTGALSVTASSGSTLGTRDGKTHVIYLYAIDNAGTVELALSTRFFDEGELMTTTAEGGAGAADSPSVAYSTTARTAVPCRLIGRFVSTQTTAGTWAAAPTKTQVLPFARVQDARVEITSGAGFGSTNTMIRYFNTTLLYEGTAITFANSSTLGASWTINEPGVYSIAYNDNKAAGSCNIGISKNSAQLTTVIQSLTNANRLQMTSVVTSNTGLVAWTGRLEAGDVIRAHGDSAADGNGDDARTKFTIAKVAD